MLLAQRFQRNIDYGFAGIVVDEACVSWGQDC